MSNLIPYNRRSSGTLGYLQDDCIPETSQVLWVGNWQADTSFNPRPNETPALVYLSDDRYVREALARYGFSLKEVKWVAGFVNPYVAIRADASKTFFSAQEAQEAFTNGLWSIGLNPKLDRFEVEWKSAYQAACGIMPVQQPGYEIVCLPGYQAVELDNQIKCEPLKKQKKRSKILASPFLPTDGDWFNFDGFNFEWIASEEAQPDAESFFHIPSVSQANNTATQIDNGQSLPKWVIPVTVGLLVFIYLRN